MAWTLLISDLKAEVATGQCNADGTFGLRIPVSRENFRCTASQGIFQFDGPSVVLRYLRFAYSAPFADFSWLPSSSRAVCQTPSAKCTLPSTERNVSLCFLLTSRAINFRSREWKGWFAARCWNNWEILMRHCDRYRVYSYERRVVFIPLRELLAIRKISDTPDYDYSDERTSTQLCIRVKYTCEVISRRLPSRCT